MARKPKSKSTNISKVPETVWRWDHHDQGNTFRALATDGKKVVAVGDKGLIKTLSSSKWITRQSGQKRNLYGITYSKEKILFVAVGYHGIIITSSNGIKWQEAVAFDQLSASLKAVAFGNNLFIAVGVKGLVRISGNGQEWRDGENPPNTELNGIHFHDGLFVATSINNTVFTTTDGDSWQRHGLGPGNHNIYGITHGNGIWVAGGAHGVCYTSKDAVTWAKSDTNTSNYLMDIIYSENEFIAVGNSDGYPRWGSMLLVSKDGKKWQREKAPIGFNPGKLPCFSTLLAVVKKGNRIYAAGTRSEVISKDMFSHGGQTMDEPTALVPPLQSGL